MKLIKPLLILICLFTFAIGCTAAEEPSTDAGNTEQSTNEMDSHDSDEMDSHDDEMDDHDSDEMSSDADSEEIDQMVADTNTTEATIYTIDVAESNAIFVIDEILNGNDKTVEGIGTIIEGNVTFNPNDLSTASIAPIIIDADSFVTDSDKRNFAIQTFILKTSDNPTITFSPTELTGLPESIIAGDTVSFEIFGELTVNNVTKTQTFPASVTWVDEGTISGTAESEILYADYDLSIPSVPFIASVDDNVKLMINFVAIAE